MCKKITSSEKSTPDANGQHKKASSLLDWVDERFPLTKLFETHMSKYYLSKNLNVWYVFGVLSLVVLGIQVVTGIFLTMNYKPDAEHAFTSVEYIMRDVNFGWLIRYMHSTGASAFFVVVYLHMFRALLYGSYKKPRELVWILGMLIYVALMAEAFMGYLLPWGQMSYWAAQVIISLFGVIPFGIGDALMLWLKGDYIIADATLNRFFALHVIAVPLVLIGLVVVHILALHTVGSNNPDGIEIKKNKNAAGIPKDGIPFHPYYTVEDLFTTVVFLIVFFAIVFFAPEMGGYFLEHANFIPADPLKTPEHIVPVWYFTPFYAILKAVPDKLGGVMAMGSSIVLLFFLPWIDRSPILSIRYRARWYKILLYAFTIAFVVLGYFGTQPTTPTGTLISRLCSLVYFGFFPLLFVLSRNEHGKPLPERVT